MNLFFSLTFFEPIPDSLPRLLRLRIPVARSELLRHQLRLLQSGLELPVVPPLLFPVAEADEVRSVLVLGIVIGYHAVEGLIGQLLGVLGAHAGEVRSDLGALDGFLRGR